MGLQRLLAVLGRDRGEDEDADQRLAFRGALSQAEASAVRGVLDQRAQALECRGTLRGGKSGAHNSCLSVSRVGVKCEACNTCIVK